jgi:hypothetical protein
MKTLGLSGEELDAVIKYSTEMPECLEPNEGALTNAELDDLAHNKLTLGLMVKARRVLAMIEISKVNKATSTIRKEDLFHYATRAELAPIEESVESGGMMIMAIFMALKQKGILADVDIKLALQALSAGEVSWDG